MLRIESWLPVQAGQICAALEEHGKAYLETWQVPMLTWDELQELKQLYEASPISALENPLAGAQCRYAQQCLLLCARLSAGRGELRERGPSLVSRGRQSQLLPMISTI